MKVESYSNNYGNGFAIKFSLNGFLLKHNLHSLDLTDKLIVQNSVCRIIEEAYLMGHEDGKIDCQERIKEALGL